MEFDATSPWYHGSPQKLTTIHTGSTITQKRELARIFSHKPPLVSIADDGQIKHNGSKPGYLYIIDEDIAPDDVIAHPRTTMAPGDEWLTQRELRVRLLGPVEIVPEEQLSDAEVDALLKRVEAQQKQSAPPLITGTITFYMREHAIHGEIVTLNQVAPTVQAAADALGVSTECIVKSVVFLADGDPVLVIASGLARIDDRRLAAHLGLSRKRIKLANAATVLDLTGFEAGAVPPFGHKTPLRTFIDPRVLAQAEIYTGSGVPEAVIRIAPQEIVRVTGAEVVGVT